MFIVYMVDFCTWFRYQVLGFGEYIEEVYAAYEQHKLETMVSVHFTFYI